jgi:hypothetical protein
LEKISKGITGSPEKIEKKEKKMYSAMKSVGVISLVAFIIMIGTFTTTTTTTITTTASQAYATTNDRRAVSETIPISEVVDTISVREKKYK